MKFATLPTGGDGRLLVVSKDLKWGAPANAVTSLQAALDDWAAVEPHLRAQYDALNAGTTDGALEIDPGGLAAVLPRSFQFLDASAFLAHNHILSQAWGYERRGEDAPPLMYQGLSDIFHPPHGEVRFRSEADQIDFEAEFGVITDAVPMGVSPGAALDHAKLLIEPPRLFRRLLSVRRSHDERYKEQVLA